MDCTRSWPATAGFLSTSILTSLTAPLAASTAFSSAGPSCLQGPHQVAQKSTITGWSREASITSAMKVASDPSLTCDPEGAADFAPASPNNMLTSASRAWPWTAPKMVVAPCACNLSNVSDHPNAFQGVEIHDLGGDVQGLEEAAQAVLRDGGGGGVGQGMEVDRLGLQQGGVQHQLHPMLGVVDQGEQGHRPRRHAQDLLHQLGRTERQA